MKEQIEKRISRLRLKMKEKGIAYYMIPTSDYHSSEYVDAYFKLREYFSNFTGSNGTLLIGQETAGLWTDGRYFIQAGRELEGTGIILFRMQEEGVPDIEQYLKDNMKEGETLAFDGMTLSCGEGGKLESKLKDKNINFMSDKDIAGELWEERPKLPANRVKIIPNELSGCSMQEKLSAVRDKLSETGTKYLLLSKLDDLMWLLNIRGSDVECNPVVLSHAFITEKEVYYFIQKEAVTEEFKAYASENNIIINQYDAVSKFLCEYEYEGKVLIDKSNISYALYKIIADHTGFISAANPTEALKAVKNKTELLKMEDIYLKDSAAVIKFIYWLKKNAGKEKITEITAAEYIDTLRRKTEGFLDLSFPTICAYKENAAMMHYEATADNNKELSAGGLLLVDSGGQYMGGTTDVTRTIALGEISGEIKMHYTKTAIGMLQLSDAKFLYGCSGKNLDILARQPLWDIGIDYKCGTGHGIGYILNVHEGPQSIRWRFAEGTKEAVLEEGMVISNEPGVYKDGSHGIRIENVIVVKKGEKNDDGQFMYFDTLTYVPIDLDAIDVSYMQPIDKERLNRYHEKVYEMTKGYLDAEEKVWLFEATRAV